MNINYTLKRSRKRRKTISLQISSSAEVVVSAPYFTSKYEINNFIREKENWIRKTIQKQKTTPDQVRKKSFTTGEFFYYLGLPCPLEAFFQTDLPLGLVFWNNCFYLNCPDAPAAGKDHFVKWYKTAARKYITGRVDMLANRMNLLPRNIRITSARTRWGSCSEENNLAFSFRLIMALPEVIDYVIVHELLHMREKNHSSKFWKLVVEVMPQYKVHRRWLRENGHRFIL
jgi:predicted metal-dependent hydrolase